MPEGYKSQWILPSGGKVLENKALLVENGTIIDIVLQSEIPEGKIVDYGRSVITPGFINAHAHLQYTDLNIPDHNIDFAGWIIELVKQYFFWSKKQKINSVKNGIKESILYGTTCIAQLSGEEEFIEVFNDLDINIYVFLETFAKDEKASNTEFKKLKEKYQKLKQNLSNNVYLGFSPHSIYNVHQVLWKQISEFSCENDILIHTHLAESVAEMEWVKNKASDIDKLHKFIMWGKVCPQISSSNPVDYLEKIGVLGLLRENLICAHLNQLTSPSFERLAHFGTNIVTCPRSNIFLHNKTINFSDIINTDHLSRIAVGTDSKFSNYDLNLINEINYIKVNASLDLLNLLDMLTINSAKMLKLDHKIGSLQKNKNADFLVFRLEDDQGWESILNKQKPDDVFIKGKPIVLSRELTKLI